MPTAEETEINQKYRPDSYLGPAGAQDNLLNSIKGAERRNMIGAMLRDGYAPLPAVLSKPSLPENVREWWGALDPSMMGGEYLPDRETREVEIARITIRSATQDVVCLYAYQGRGRIRYRVVDEYDGDTLEGRVKRTSLRPLTLCELTDFLLEAWGLIPVLDMNFSDENNSLEDALNFFRGESQFYPDFDALLRVLVKAWWVGERADQLVNHVPTDAFGQVIISAELVRAYEATHYQVDTPAGGTVLKVGEPFSGLDEFPGQNRLAIVTAHNPFSQPVQGATNSEAQSQLVRAVEAEGLAWLPATGIDPQGKWPPEPSLAVLEPTVSLLDRWMGRFRQNAIVVAERGGMVKLRLHPAALIVDDSSLSRKDA